MLDGKAFMNKDFQGMTLPTPLMFGDCVSFTHQDTEVQAFRNLVPIKARGDFEFSVTCLNRTNAQGADFERFVATNLHQRLHRRAEPKDASKRFHFREWYDTRRLEEIPPAEQAVSYVASLPYYRAPVEVLWDFTNFGVLRWDRLKESAQRQGHPAPARDGVHAPTTDGFMFLPNIYAEVRPDLMPQDIEGIREDALKMLKHLPKMRSGLLRHAMAEAIDKEIQPLAALCSKHGTFGEAVLPGAFHPIMGIFLRSHDGNSQEAFIETEEHFYTISLVTS
ncbi:hypothetical protein [Streptomyces sp. CG 926]|uniref:hypothetical protein n=1 Tax=Streptomyces sp. CG 926 TaxID=1882405 RepID=UPI0015E808BD|nr:hypothetical protein [Streptomyces sp. CG 926]